MYEVGALFVVLYLVVALLIILRSIKHNMFDGYNNKESANIIVLITLFWPVFLVWGILEKKSNRKDFQ
jgi:hypothetical protein